MCKQKNSRENQSRITDQGRGLGYSYSLNGAGA